MSVRCVVAYRYRPAPLLQKSPPVRILGFCVPKIVLFIIIISIQDAPKRIVLIFLRLHGAILN